MKVSQIEAVPAGRDGDTDGAASMSLQNSSSMQPLRQCETAAALIFMFHHSTIAIYI